MARPKATLCAPRGLLIGIGGHTVPGHRRLPGEEGAQGVSSLSQHPGPFSSWTYPVLASVALTLTHTATKTAGRPVGTEGNGMRG